ncbi:UDP-glucuronosyl/UDP-glucosyltransferase [Parasponia andersonii]|uniref:Glycosyltransferase n=1 Tax=Parasponia andersonii TaxID=3476 RepID=A0A2P5A5C9_PARAD|nr:UDP-glucuronosyl/UDP-glucosyltransferase [Parasponia andersonii]
MASESNQLHFVMIPLMAPGHLIPMADMARLLAENGVMVTVVTTPVNASRIRPVIDRATAKSCLQIQLVQLPLPLHEAGLPEGCESFDLVPSRNLYRNFFTALEKLQQPIEQLLKELKPSPKCIIADRHLAWTAEIAKKIRIPRVLFDGMSSFALLCTHNIRKSRVHESVPKSTPFVVPDMPHQVEFTIDQLPGDLHPSSEDVKDIHKKITESEEGAYGFVVNSFEELESGYIEGCKKEKGDRVWCIGPVSLFNKTELDKAQRGNNIAAIDENQCLKWLESWPKNSVIYACFGSLNRLLLPQLVELGLGLESSNRPFIWVVRGYNTQELEKWIVESGFEQRTKSRGLLIHGWAPQVLILSHPSVGGFLTHCGWNSTLEGVTCGKPMITWPLFADQFYNEKLVVQVLRVGESVGVKSAVPLGKEEEFGVLVKRGDVKEAIDKVMDGGKEGEERRERAKTLVEMAKKAIEEGGSSYLNMKLFIEDIRKLDICDLAML